jgi:plastocyanin
MRHLVLPSAATVCAFTTLTAGIGRAQQFQGVTSFPGTGYYSEGLECADVDQDGDLDVFVADGDGFSTAGTQRQSHLYINKLVETATPWTLVDESVARLGTHISNAKGVTTGDVNGDGWVDALYANAFNTQVPFLYINQGAGNPGFFNMESATRGFTVALSSGSGAFADLDDDGDLDLILNDAFNSTPAKKAHLYINDGTGVFTENAAALNSPLRSGQMDVQLVDVDNNWTIDFFGIDKMTTPSASQFLLLNNGAATFTDASSLITTASGNSYEAEIGDLDGDNDVDMFFVSLSGFAEGAVKNNIVPSGTLTFTNQTAIGGDDDNEISLFDYDNDGDYDILVGSLGGTEKFYRNDGAFTFVAQNSIIQAQADSTLDCTVADLNNDGKYDVITAQGESGSFINKFYKNTGSADTLPPVLVAEQVPPTAVSGSSVVAHTKIRDQVLDDGVNYVTSTGDYVILTAPQVAAISIVAGAFSPSAITVPAGTTITWSNASGGSQSVQSTTAPYTYNSGTIVAGGTYARTFVKPGTYNYTSVPGGFSATVTVTGTSNAVTTLAQGGQQYRARMDDTAGGTGIELCYELRFRDWPGNILVAPSHRVPLTGATTGTGYCFGDGSATACPCGNTAVSGAGTGCLNSLGTGARLFGSGVASISADTLVLQGTGMPNSSALYFQGTAQQNGGLGSVFGDGLRCAAGSVLRLGTKVNTAGASNYPVGVDLIVSIKGAVSAPGTRNYQVWYRNAAAFCQPETFNLSNGLSVVWGL